MTTISIQAKNVEVHVNYLPRQEATQSPEESLAWFFVQVMLDRLNEPVPK